MKSFGLIILKTFLLFSAIVMLQSCEKPEGEGGYCTVTGSVWVRDYNATFTNLVGEYAGADEAVYIIYGDALGYSERIRTDYRGTYSFNYLRPGNYTVYVYSKDSTLQSISGTIAVVQQFEISKGDKNIELPHFIIYN